jgi:hypothetical protein
MLWDWGFLWKSIEVESCPIAINATASGLDGNTGKQQGTGVSLNTLLLLSPLKYQF